MSILQDIEDAQVAHVRTASPSDLEAPADETALRTCIQLAITRADLAGFTEHSALVTYVQAVVDFGIGFAADPFHSWANAAMASNGAAHRRGEILRRSALSAAPALTPQEWRHAGNVADQLSDALAHPETATSQELPLALLRHLATDIRRALDLDESAITQPLANPHSPAGMSVFLLRAILFGHEWNQDPRYAAAPEAINDPGQLLADCRCRIAAKHKSMQVPQSAPSRLANGQRLTVISLHTPIPERAERLV